MNARRAWLPLALAVAVMPLLLAGACAEDQGPATGTPMDLEDPAELGALAARVEREPARTDELLADAGVSRVELHRAILAVAQEPDASREYRDAFEAELDRGGGGVSASRSGS